VAAGGSFISGVMDEHCDLDLVIVSVREIAKDALRDAELYTDLRERVAPPTLKRRAGVERAVRDFLRA
jgi:hypothetical protein